MHQTVEPDVLLLLSEMGLWRHALGAVRHQIWATVVSVLDSSEERQVGASSVGKAETQVRMSYQDAGGEDGVDCKGRLAGPSQDNVMISIMVFESRQEGFRLHPDQPRRPVFPPPAFILPF